MQNEVIEYLPPQSLIVRPQVRKQISAEEEAGLVQSIKEVGLLQPIRAKLDDDKRVIVDGHRRTAAAIKIGMATVPVIVERSILSDSATVQRQLIANCQRSDLTAIEKATAIQQLMQAESWSGAQVASKLGISAPSVARLLALLQLPDAIRARVATGEIPASAGYELAKVTDPAEQVELAEQLAAGTLTRDGLATGRKAKQKQPAIAGKVKTVRVTIDLGAGRVIRVEAPGLTMSSCAELVQELGTKLRRGQSQHVELLTWCQMLADQAKVQA
jgi:ParB/RepB/Spo0J family partition protein